MTATVVASDCDYYNGSYASDHSVMKIIQRLIAPSAEDGGARRRASLIKIAVVILKYIDA